MTPAWSPTQKFGKTKQAFASFVSNESSELNSILLKGVRVSWKINWIIHRNLSTPFQKCSQSYLNLSLLPAETTARAAVCSPLPSILAHSQLVAVKTQG